MTTTIKNSLKKCRILTKGVHHGINDRHGNSNKSDLLYPFIQMEEQRAKRFEVLERIKVGDSYKGVAFTNPNDFLKVLK